MPSRVRRLSPLVAFAAFLPALAAAQRPPLETIVLTGDPAPGIPGGAFSFIFGRATINTHGGIAFTASLPVRAELRQCIWRIGSPKTYRREPAISPPARERFRPSATP